MSKNLKKIIIIMMTVVMIMESSMVSFAYGGFPKHGVFVYNDLYLEATPIYYETEKFPEFDTSSRNFSDPQKSLYMNYTEVVGNIFSSGTILLGVQMKKGEENNHMCQIKFNGLNLESNLNYVVTFEVDTNFYGLARMEPSYSVFGGSKLIKTRYEKNGKDWDAYVYFWIYDELLMDGFTVSTDRYATGPYKGKADVISCENASAFATGTPCSIGEVKIGTFSTKRKLKKALNGSDIYFNGIKVADNVEFTDDV